MFYKSFLLATTALTGLVSAQNYSTSGALSVVPNSVAYVLRQSWCRAQTNSCPEICGGQAYPNNCDPSTLNYTCTCSNGNSPNISNYDQTVPSFVCAQWKTDCVAAHPNDLTGQTACLSVTCGMANASSGESSSSSSAASSTAASSGSASTSAAATTTGSSGGSSASASSTGAAASASASGSAAILNYAATYGLPTLMAGMAAVFGLAL